MSEQLALWGSLEEATEHLLTVRSHLDAMDESVKTQTYSHLQLLLAKIHVDLALESVREVKDATPPF